MRTKLHILSLVPMLISILACSVVSSPATPTATPAPSLTPALIFTPMTAPIIASVTPLLPTAASNPTVASAAIIQNCTPRADWAFTYTIAAGDTLSGLAQQTGTTADVLATGNCLANANAIEVGQVIRLPGAVTGQTSSAATGNRIQFAPGATSVTVQGQVAANTVQRWIIAAQASQTMSVQLTFTAGQAVLSVSGADGIVLQPASMNAATFNGVLTKTQDYYLDVTGNPNMSTSYSLTLIIPPLAPS